MKKITIILFTTIPLFLFAQDVKLMSWNIANLGGSKDSTEVAIMADLIKDYDVVAIQEVVGSEPGPLAVKRLTVNLNKVDSVSKWKYVISSKTIGHGVERYAFVYKSSKLSVKSAMLAPMLIQAVDREPFVCTFKKDLNEFTVVSFHAVPTKKKPEKENSQLIRVHEDYFKKNLIFCGDFNQEENNVAFDELKRAGFLSAIKCHKTSLKMKRLDNGSSFSKAYDNFFYEYANILVRTSYVINFSTDFETVKQARYVSDHCPIILEFNFR